MKLWVVKPGEPLPGDLAGPLRAGALADDLSRLGHETTWWTSAFDWRSHSLTYQSDQEVVTKAGAVVKVLTSVGYASNVSLGRLVDAAHFALRLFRQMRRAEPPDVVLACAPPVEAAIAAGIYARVKDRPFVLDVRDHWVENYRLHLGPRLPRPIWSVASLLVSLQTKLLLWLATDLVAISTSFASWLQDSSSKSVNVIPIGHLRPDEATPLEAQRTPGVVWYCGSLNTGVDFATVVSAARELVAQGEHRVRFIISGGGIHEALLREADAELPNVEFTGWVGPEERRHLQSTVWCGLMPRIDVTYSAMGNKYFEYFGAGLPVLTNDPGVMDEIEERELGLGFDRLGRPPLHEAIVDLLNDEDRYLKLQRNVRSCAADEFSRQSVAGQFEQALLEISERAGEAL